jgi:NADPH:quinone reductase-like Zn-dependent oxidoreductase
MAKSKIAKPVFPAQHQNKQPGAEAIMNPLPIFENPNYQAAGKLKGKTAVITGGDSGIGKATAVLFAKEGADIVLVYLDEHEDAQFTKYRIEQTGMNV